MRKGSMRHPLLALVALAVVFVLACDLSSVPAPVSLPGLPSLPGAATATPAMPPGVYVSNIRLDPPAVYAATPTVTFFVTFNNSAGGARTYRWLVKIYRSDNPDRSIGETAIVTSDLPPGDSEFPSARNWKVNVRTCEQYVARVFGSDVNVGGGNPVEFAKPDASGNPSLNFQVCP